jgi:hypothetical protein
MPDQKGCDDEADPETLRIQILETTGSSTAVAAVRVAGEQHFHGAPSGRLKVELYNRNAPVQPRAAQVATMTSAKMTSQTRSRGRDRSRDGPDEGW